MSDLMLAGATIVSAAFTHRSLEHCIEQAAALVAVRDGM
jgi:hypothetical protein